MTDDPQKPWFPIRTRRLLLREFREDDFDDVHAYAEDPLVSRYMDWGPNTPDMTRQHLDRVLAEQEPWPRPQVSLAVELMEEGRVIGSARMALRGHDDADLGYSYHSAYWGQGYGYEVADALVETAFGVLALHRVWATCDVRNRGSFGIMEKLGMRREGTFRRDLKVRDGWRDTHFYALLAEEWAARRSVEA
jgi:ribosomal-protein-alanine N-acetyltransferase